MPIKCENLTKKYDGKLVLDRWTATISDTGVTAIMGPSGIGKTTLFRLLAGLEKADDGRITGLSGKKLSVVFQEDRLFPQLTVLKNLQVAGDGAEKWLSRLGLSEAAQQYPEELSGGMKRRAGIAQAMLNDPKILILDEPTAGLDPKERIRFRNLISELAENRLVLLSTHIVSDVEYIADQILLMKDGSLVHHGTSQQLLAAAPTQVWVCTVPRAQADQLLHQYPVVNLKTLPQGVQLRVLSQTPPVPEAHPAEMTLEDLFLHYFGETAGETDAAL